MRNIYSKLVVPLVIGLNYWFANEIIEVFKLVGSEPMTLIGCWFAFTTGELWMLSGITKTKTKVKGGTDNGNQTGQSDV